MNERITIKDIAERAGVSPGTVDRVIHNRPNVSKKAYPFSFALFHSGQTYVGGETTSVHDVIDFNRSVDNKIREYVVSNTKITEELYAAHHRKQWYISAEEMLEYGLINEIIGK